MSEKVMVDFTRKNGNSENTFPFIERQTLKHHENHMINRFQDSLIQMNVIIKNE